MLKQKTLNNSFSLSGKGLHTGLNLTVTFLPASKNHGYKIQRIDMEGQPILDAVAENVIDTKRGTVLGKGDFKCSTIEHAMAAFYALGVDNVLIQVDGPEFPILDGSAEPYVKEILRVKKIFITSQRRWNSRTKIQVPVSRSFLMRNSLSPA